MYIVFAKRGGGKFTSSELIVDFLDYAEGEGGGI